MLIYVTTTCYTIKASITKIIKKDIERAHKIQIRKDNRLNSNNTNNIIPLVTENNKTIVTIDKRNLTLV